MNDLEFTTLISIYGSDPKRWPEPQRTDALVFIQSNEAQAALLLQDEQDLDAMLSQCGAREPSDLLKSRILRNLPTQQSAFAARRNTASPGWPGIAAMVLAAFGLGFGGANMMPSSTSSSDPTVLMASTDNIDVQILQTADHLGFSDVYYWVQGEDVTSLPSGI